MSRPLRVLMVEDSEADAELLSLNLRQGDYDATCSRVDSAKAMAAALKDEKWDVVIADYVLPRFSGLAALRLLQETGLDLPFIVVSGQIGEETAVEVMKAGAHDFILKRNLARLGPAIERELREAAMRHERRQADEALRKAKAVLEKRVQERTAEVTAANEQLRAEIAERQKAEEARERLVQQIKMINSQLVTATMTAEDNAVEAERRAAELDAIVRSVADGLIVYSPAGETVLLNPVAEKMLQLAPQEWAASLEDWAALVQAETIDGEPFPIEEMAARRALAGQTTHSSVMAIRQEPDELRWLSFSGAPVQDHEGKLLGAVVTFSDITQQREAEKLREDYVHLISHDLRNPLTALMGYAQMLARSLGRLSLEREAANAGEVLREARRINGMLQDLVESTHLESGQLEMKLVPADLPSLVEETATRVGSEADRARISVVCNDQIPLAVVDPNRFERVITNLVSNALKYSPPDEPVIVSVGRDRDRAIVSVIDRGEGIPHEETRHIFQRFYRVRTGKKIEGLGLGLYIARLIVEAHGGRIWVESEPGKGSAFHVALPLVQPSLATPATRRRND